MKICILDPSYDYSDSPFKQHESLADPRPFLQGHDCEYHHIHKQTAVKQVRDLIKKGFDVFINLCDGAWEEDRAGIEVVQVLESYNQAFTGASSSFYEPTREIMKLVCHYWGINTPDYVFVANISEVDTAVANMRFPMITKHPNSYGSISLSKASCVTNIQDLKTQAKRMIDLYGSTLIEEFIDGREFTALVVENADDPENPIVYYPAECIFPKNENFKHFDLKWAGYEGLHYIPCPDQQIATRISEMTRKFFLGINGTGYGRCDIRMDKDGELFMLEINPNCGVYYPEGDGGSADSLLRKDKGGHMHFTEMILKAAVKRKKQQSKKWKLLLANKGSYKIYATQTIEQGEIVEPFEEHPHILVTKKHVANNWNPIQKDWFKRYAYPLTDEIWVLWSSDPLQWKPIGHSCDPNTWMNGLNLVARRKIKKGEQITMDYATFLDENMAEFHCVCGSAKCRKIVRGTDYTQSFMQEYGDHISDYIRNKRSTNKK